MSSTVYHSTPTLYNLIHDKKQSNNTAVIIPETKQRPEYIVSYNKLDYTTLNQQPNNSTLFLFVNCIL